MTGARAGFVQTSFLIGFAVSLFFSSWPCDHVGAKRMFLWFSWASAATALAFALFARSYAEAIWLHGLVGVTQGGRYTRAIMLVAQELPPSRRGAGAGWMLAGMSAGYVGSISLANALIATVDYQTAFLVCAAGPVAGAAFGALAAARVENRIAPPPCAKRSDGAERRRRSDRVCTATGIRRRGSTDLVCALPFLRPVSRPPLLSHWPTRTDGCLSPGLFFEAPRARKCAIAEHPRPF